MPRPFFAPLAAAAVLAALPSGVSAEIAAAAAGTLFEAAPFLLLAELAARYPLGGLTRLIPLAGCGCRSARIPGGLALPALALCWLSFGPALTLVRAAAGAIVAARRTGRETGGEAPDVFLEMERLAWAAGAAALLRAVLAHAELPEPLALAGGLALGAVVPCAAAGIALAAGLAASLPAVAAGVLATAGLVDVSFRHRTTGQPAQARAAGAALAFALALLAVHGPGGLVNPRLLPVVAAGAVLAFVGIGRRWSRTRLGPLVPAAMAATLLLAAPPPAPILDETHLAAAYPRAHLRFTGVARTRGGATTLARLAIACCRLDATAVGVRLDRPLAVPDGSWVRAEGTMHAAGAALVLHADTTERVTPPADPFLYW